MKSKSLIDRLITIERGVSIHKKGRGESINKINIDNISFDFLKNIVEPKEDDPLLYDGYKLDNKQLAKLNNYLDKKISINLKLYDYFLICGGIYDWDGD